MKKFINHLREKGLSENTIKSYESSIKLLKLEDKDIRIVIKKIISYNSNPNTIRFHKNVAINYYKFYKNKNYLKIENIKMPPVELKYMKALTKNYIYRKTDINDQDDKRTIYFKLIFRFLFETGMRANELFNILEIKNESLVILGKGNKKREIFYKKETLDKILKINKDVFTETTKTLRIWIKRIIHKDVSLHTLRRSFATHMLNSGCTPQLVMKQMGHRDINTTYKYLNNTFSQNKRIYNKYF